MSTQSYRDRDDDISTHQNHVERMVAYYARTASQYNKWHCDVSNDSSHNYAVREVLGLMNRVKAKTLLDVCCGTGRAVRAALAAGFDARGIDVSMELIEAGVRDLKLPPNRLAVGDATKLPYADRSFDVACVFGALHHTARPRAVVSEVLRVARSGVVISDEANHFSGGCKSVLIRMGIFEPVYRMIFRRPPRTQRRQVNSDTDGPAFVFSIEEVIPLVKARFPKSKCLTFYRVGNKLQVCSYRFPRLFARQAVFSAWEDA
jgi:ubiquinone/menaquinone biosynthesis C-methylase UbiE